MGWFVYADRDVGIDAWDPSIAADGDLLAVYFIYAHPSLASHDAGLFKWKPDAVAGEWEYVRGNGDGDVGRNTDIDVWGNYIAYMYENRQDDCYHMYTNWPVGCTGFGCWGSRSCSVPTFDLHGFRVTFAIDRPYVAYTTKTSPLLGEKLYVKGFSGENAEKVEINGWIGDSVDWEIDITGDETAWYATYVNKVPSQRTLHVLRGRLGVGEDDLGGGVITITSSSYPSKPAIEMHGSIPILAWQESSGGIRVAQWTGTGWFGIGQINAGGSVVEIRMASDGTDFYLATSSFDTDYAEIYRWDGAYGWNALPTVSGNPGEGYVTSLGIAVYQGDPVIVFTTLNGPVRALRYYE